MTPEHLEANKRPDPISKQGPRTSSDPERPMGLVVVPGTPVVDCRHEVFGRAVAVTPGFCVMRPGRGSAGYCVCPWRDVAVGHVAPVPGVLPGRAEDKDRLDYCAALLAELEGLRTAAGLTPLLKAARKEVLRTLRSGPEHDA